MRITEHIDINASPDDVWAVISDPSTHTAWRPALVEFRPLDGEPLAVGSRIREVLRFGRREIELEDVVTVLEPPRRLGINGSWKAASFEAELVLAPTEGGTHVTFDWTFEPKSVLARVGAPFLKGSMARSTEDELDGLKTYVENKSRVAAGA
ncbi:MAG: SRPBCC family protein [Actinobacteria bacterium]|nr:SRPBCC family protein [Actinomycetota bacterium]